MKIFALMLLLATGSFFSTSASAIAIGTYKLNNHPDGGAQPPLYGLRLDGLLGDPTKEYTFDFDHIDSDMNLIWDGTKIVIDGQAFGGEDGGSSYVVGTTDVWDIHVEYTVGVSQAPVDGGVDDITVKADNANFGTISSLLFGNFQLEDEANNSGYSLKLGDLSGSGHRGHPGISGWGWLNHGSACISAHCTHVSASDWLFTASPVPVPAAAWLFGTGLLGLIGIARRR